MVDDHLTLRPSKGSSKRASDTTVADQLPSDLDVDIERASASSVLPLDPFQLRDGVLSERDLNSLRRRNKKGAHYHQRQNDLINSLLKPMEDHTAEARADEDDARLPSLTLEAMSSFSGYTEKPRGLTATVGPWVERAWKPSETSSMVRSLTPFPMSQRPETPF
ncbi:hypothetical protein DXG03_008331 [Asterophora parasitica]|uniref:Uncharacterized protein n=1 Tax=Asterophora parasitica TaxID=117018 RepID=A0A9P7G049_9AGAR|nr:hypothetical protein DXG03_008331 [Asterophora parasitica]